LPEFLPELDRAEAERLERDELLALFSPGSVFSS
jgi:hypothetical protein